MRLNHQQPSFQDKATPCRGPKSINGLTTELSGAKNVKTLLQATERLQHRYTSSRDAAAARGNRNSSITGALTLTIDTPACTGMSRAGFRGDRVGWVPLFI